MKCKWHAMLLAIVMLLSVFSACGSEDVAKDPVKNDDKTVKTLEEATEEETFEEVKTEETPAKEAFALKGLVAEKIGTISDENSVMEYAGGLIYRDGNLYGVGTLDGKSKTDLKYTMCQHSSGYFLVSERSEEVASVADLNSVGVVDVKGNVLVPFQYASVDVLNDRYIEVCEVTEKTENKDEALVFYSSNSFAIFPDEDSLFFKGVWYVYDVETGERVEGVTGTHLTSVSAKGNYISYSTESGSRVSVNAEGKELPEGATLFENGCYWIEKDGKITVYDSNDKKVFAVDEDDFAPYSSQGEYYYARKDDTNGTSYAVMNAKGKVISAAFDKYFTLEDQFITIDETLYALDGTELYKAKSSLLRVYESGCGLYVLKDDAEYMLMDQNGTIYLTEADNDNLLVDTSNYTIQKKENDIKNYFCVMDKAYSISGKSANSEGLFLVEVYEDYDNRNLVDTISGKVLLEGYEDFSAITIDETTYVYAEKGETVEIYQISLEK